MHNVRGTEYASGFQLSLSLIYQQRTIGWIISWKLTVAFSGAAFLTGLTELLVL